MRKRTRSQRRHGRVVVRYGLNVDDAAVTKVLEIVERIPKGSVMTYGQIAALAALRSPRQVGAIMARCGHETNWHRVVNASGKPAPHLRDEQLALLRGERVAIRDGHVVLERARAECGTSHPDADFGVDDH